MPKQKRPSKARQRSYDLVDALDESARYWGWQQDQGTGSSVAEAEASYNADKQSLIDHINRLHNKIEQLQYSVKLARQELS